MYSLIIIGGGAVACGYDSPNDKDIITHIHGALLHPKIHLNAIVELKKDRREYIIKKWGNSFEVFSNLKDCIKKYKSDIVIVSTPTNSHLRTIKELLSLYNPTLIIVEKPIVSNLLEFKKLNTLSKKTKVKMITHFTRRFDPSMNTLTKLIKNEKKIHHFYGTFSKGLIHNGSHMIDLVNRLLGDIQNIKNINKKIINSDIFGKFLVETERSSGIISNIRNNQLAVFDLIIYTDKLKIEIIDNKKNIFISYIKNNQKIKNEKTYSKKKILKKTLNQWGYNLFEYVIKLINDDALYKELKKEQDGVNQLIFKIQKKLFLKNNNN